MAAAQAALHVRGGATVGRPAVALRSPGRRCRERRQQQGGEPVQGAGGRPQLHLVHSAGSQDRHQKPALLLCRIGVAMTCRSVAAPSCRIGVGPLVAARSRVHWVQLHPLQVTLHPLALCFASYMRYWDFAIVNALCTPPCGCYGTD